MGLPELGQGSQWALQDQAVTRLDDHIGRRKDSGRATRARVLGDADAVLGHDLADGFAHERAVTADQPALHRDHLSADNETADD